MGWRDEKGRGGLGGRDGCRRWRQSGGDETPSERCSFTTPLPAPRDDMMNLTEMSRPPPPPSTGERSRIRCHHHNPFSML